MSWRKVQLRGNHYPKSRGGICINGVLYYLAAGYQNIEKIACFDVRSEKLRFLDEDSTTRSIFSCSSRSLRLINYKGKLGVTSLVRIRNYGQQFSRLRLRLWILEDVQKQDWLHREYLPENFVYECRMSVVGVTAYGEIILSPDYLCAKPFVVLYINPERNTLQQVLIQGLEAPKISSSVYTFVDYAEDYRFT
ncbi:PREDICTED: putative F-box protein At5g52620 [Camelina sativa]|uniref:F-box protein At5g52620 n=1 Tax=Camelina sativa TaxID=90675 RepID=A0ABM0WMK3_CAMSA|nr:PREDICTED: putative F-box protein At5g52620 [Camelina sativa]